MFTGKELSERASKEHKPTLVLVLLLIGGLISLVISIIINSPGMGSHVLIGSPQEAHIASFIANLLEHLGVAVILAAIVGLVLESELYGNYFLHKIASTVVKRDYLSKLSLEELEKLQIDLVQAYYKLENLDVEHGFYRYFRKLYEYIKLPYREGVRDNITITYSDSSQTIFKIEEVISFGCHKIGGCIQENVNWTAAKDEIKSMSWCVVKVFIPYDLFTSKEFKETSNLTKRETIWDSRENPAQLKKYASGHGYIVSLKEFSGIDGLRVEVTTEYFSSVERGLSWTMSDPSKGISIDITYPPELKIHVDYFGVAIEESPEPSKPGKYHLEYDSWLLPDSGFAFRFLKTEEDDASPPAR